MYKSYDNGQTWDQGNSQTSNSFYQVGQLANGSVIALENGYIYTYKYNSVSLPATVTPVTATGSGYTLTTTSQLVTFGTLSPTVSLNLPGLYLIYGRVNIQFTGSVTNSSYFTINFKIRRTSYPSADQTGSITTVAYGLNGAVPNNSQIINLSPVYYYTNNCINFNNTVDVLQVWGSASSTNYGTVVVNEASIVAVRIA
jgi:hypothetical protein